MATTGRIVQPVGGVGDVAQEKLRLPEKFAYALAIMGVTPLTALMATYLTIFYTDVVGLNPVAVGTLFLISRIADGFSDPLMGYAVDRMPRTRMGKFRYLLIVGGILCSLNYLLVWFGPVWVTSGKLAVAYISYLLLGFTFDILDISKNSLLPAMTANMKERSTLGVIFGFGSILAGTAAAVAAPLILAAGDSSAEAYFTLIIITVGVALFCSIVGALGIKERVTPASEGNSGSLKTYLSIFAQRPVIATLAFTILFSTGYYLTSGVNAYFYTYVMNDLSLLSGVSLILLLGLLPGIFTSGVISRRLGKKRTFVLAALLMIAALMIRWIDPRSLVLIYISTVVTGFNFGLFLPMSAVVQADNTDYTEYALHRRSEPALASISTFISKLGSGIAGAVPGFVLGWAGYVAGGQQQPDSAITAIILVALAIPVLFFAGAAVVFGLGYNLDKNLLQQVETTLSERRAAKAAPQE